VWHRIVVLEGPFYRAGELGGGRLMGDSQTASGAP
jgi:hypothetical protein